MIIAHHKGPNSLLKMKAQASAELVAAHAEQAIQSVSTTTRSDEIIMFLNPHNPAIC